MEIKIEVKVNKIIEAEIDVNDIIDAINNAPETQKWNASAQIINNLKFSHELLHEDHKKIIIEWLDNNLKLLNNNNKWK